MTTQRSQKGIERGGYVLVACLAIVALNLPGCGEEGVTRPDNYNTLKYKPVTITTTRLESIEATEGRYGSVRPFSGVHGSPEPVIPGDADLVSLYWAQNCAPNPALPDDPSCPPDGAHLTMVRVGTDTLCDISADAIFPNPDADTNNPQNYDFSALDAHMQAIREVGNSAQTQILWQFGLSPLSDDGCQAEGGIQLGSPISICGDSLCQGQENAGTCPRDCPAQPGDGFCTGEETPENTPDDCTGCGDGSCEGETAASCAIDCGLGMSSDGACNGDETAISSPNDCRSQDRRWPEMARNILSHLNEGNGWDPNGRKFDVRYVEFMDDPHARLGYTEGAVPELLFDRYREFAAALKLRWPDDVNPDDPSDVQPQIHVGGISYTLTQVEDLTFETEDQKHPLLKFIDFIADEDSATCPKDCGARCGDGACNSGESFGSCPSDCAASCGDDECDAEADEDALSCPADCGSPCGDNICSESETASSPLAPNFCYEDCGPACGNGICGVPLDFVSFRVKAPHPHDVACIAAGVRGYLDEKGLENTQIIITNVEPDLASSDFDDVSQIRDSSAQDSDTATFRSTHLGAFLAASRIFLQSPLRNTCPYAAEGRSTEWMIAGRVPRVFSDLQGHVGEDLVPLQDEILESPFVEPDGTAKPAFMSLFPFRQVARDHAALQVGVLDSVSGDWEQGNGTKGFAVMATQRGNATNKMHVIIANADVQDGNADINYELQIEGFGADQPDFGFVEYKLAVLDRDAVGRESFQFTDTGILETSADKLTFVHQMAVPSVHYIEFVNPTACVPAQEVAMETDGDCPANYSKNASTSMCVCSSSDKRCSPDCAAGEYCTKDSDGWCQ